MTKVRREDQGNYTVNAHSPKGSVNASFFVNVQYPPEKITAVKRFTVSEGGTSTLECSAKGNPTPKIIWSRSNRSEPLVSGLQMASLVIDNASKDDTGIYVCSASNGIGKTATTESSVIVNHGAIIVRDAKSSSGSWAIEGGKGLIMCHSRAAPEPSFLWSTLDSQTIQNGHKYKIQDPQLVDNLTLWVSTLEVFDIAQADYGEYRCTTNNALGADTVLMSLRPPDKPHPPSDIKLINKTFSSITFSWVPSKLEGGPIHSYTIRYKDEENVNFQEITIPPRENAMTLYDLESGKTYLITVYASNNKGSSSFIEPPLLVSLPAEPIGSITNSRSNIGTMSANSKMKNKGVTIGGWRVPRLVLLITTLTGATLLVLNIAIIACFVKRRNHVRNVSVSSSKTTYGESSVTFGSNQGAPDDSESHNQSRRESPKSSTQGAATNRENGSPGTGQVIKVVQMSPPPNGHLPRTGSVVMVSKNKSTDEGSQSECSRSVDLLQGSVSPEGRRAAAVNPEVCSIASSTYDHMQKRSSNSCNPLDERNGYSGDDQISLASYHSDFVRSYSYGRSSQNHLQTRDDQESNGHSTLQQAPMLQVAYQSKLQIKPQQQIGKTGKCTNRENHGQYASLNVANLRNLEANYFESHCCSGQDSKACDCPSSNHVIGYATLGSKNRRARPPQFATLQRNRPLQVKFKASSFDSNGQMKCHCGLQSNCQCPGNSIPRDPSQPCSLPTCLTSSTVDHQHKSLHDSYLKSYSDDKFRITTGGLIKSHHTSQENILDDIHSMKTLTLRKNNCSKMVANSNSDKNVTTFKVRPDSPKSIRKLSTRSSSIEIECSKLSPVHRNGKGKMTEGLFQSTSFNASPNVNHSRKNNDPDSSIKSDVTSSSSSCNSSYNRPKFPRDYVKQANGSTGDVSSYDTMKITENNVTPNCVSPSELKSIR